MDETDIDVGIGIGIGIGIEVHSDWSRRGCSMRRRRTGGGPADPSRRHCSSNPPHKGAGLGLGARVRGAWATEQRGVRERGAVHVCCDAQVCHC